jgi:micrococcal nuclease
MRRWNARSASAKTAIVAAGLVIAVAAASFREKPLVQGGTIAIASVVDGDTIELTTGRRVRLVQIDAPEPWESECWSREARAALRSLLPRGTRVRLRRDPRLGDVDRSRRLLRYVFKGSTNVNLELIRIGAASVWFPGGARGRYASELLAAARMARSAHRGLWGGCPRTRLDPLRGVEPER